MFNNSVFEENTTVFSQVESCTSVVQKLVLFSNSHTLRLGVLSQAETIITKVSSLSGN